MTKDQYAPVSMQSLVEEMLNSSAPYTPPEDKEVLQKMAIDLAKYSRNLENRVFTLTQSISRMNSQVLDASPSSSKVTDADDADDDLELLFDLNNISVQNVSRLFFTKASPLTFLAGIEGKESIGEHSATVRAT